jgi:cytidine deaminase
LSDSERDKSVDRWPAADRRRQKDRRAGRDRRAGADRRGASERRTTVSSRIDTDRRGGGERRQAERRTQGERRSESGWNLVPPLDALPATGDPPDASLLAAALDARQHAHAPYSGFAVGAALETADGRVITGCNIENATYGLTLCAERVALVKALSEGHAVFTRIAVVADTVAPTPPCGPCRQLLWEYCGDIEVILGNLQTTTGRYRLASLLPLPFDRRLLE